jgi:hypothetical protein
MSTIYFAREALLRMPKNKYEYLIPIISSSEVKLPFDGGLVRSSL